MLEDVVRPSSLQLAREAVSSGMQVEAMCLKPAWNQRCLSCGLHSGWACECSGAQKQKAHQEHVERVRAPDYSKVTTRLYPNDGLSPVNVPTGDKLTDVPDLCPRCSERPPEKGRNVCSACRKAAYRERSK